MRIIGGKYKGKNIEVYSGFKDHPTTDMAKEALFNILSNYYNFENIAVCDLFAGTGNISFEFASRGTQRIICVDINKHYINFIQNTSKNIFQGAITAICSDVFSFIKENNLNYDVIFADPPYMLSNINTLPATIFANNSVPNDAIVVIEHSDKTHFEDNQYFRKEKKYGKVHLSFFSKQEI